MKLNSLRQLADAKDSAELKATSSVVKGILTYRVVLNHKLEPGQTTKVLSMVDYL